MQRIYIGDYEYELVKPTNLASSFQYENHTPIQHDPYQRPAPRTLQLALLSQDQEAAANERYLPYCNQQTLAFIRYYMNHVATEATYLPAGQYEIEDDDQSFSFTLDEDMVYLDSMDLDELISHRQIVMEFLLRPENKDRYYPAGSHLIALRDSGGALIQLCYFTTKVDLAVRQDKYDHMVCDVINTAIEGNGMYGAVYEISGSFKHRYFHPVGIHFEPGGGKRLIKVVCEKDNYAATFNYRADHETMMMQRLRHFQSRNTFFGMTANEKRMYAVSMRKFNGCDLQVLLDADLEQTALRDSDRFEIAIEVLRAVSSQVFDCGVIHNDIKPDNIRVWKNETGWHVAILDAGISILAGAQDHLRIFAATYAPREAEDGKRTRASDIFSIALVIAMLFRDRKQRNMVSTVQKGLIRLLRERNHWAIDFDMFVDMPNLPDACKSAIRSLLSAMTHVDQDARPDIDYCIQQLKSIYQLYIRLTSHLNDDENEHFDNGDVMMAGERYESLRESFRAELRNSWQLIKRFNSLYEKHVNDDSKDKEILFDLKSYSADLKDFTSRRYVKIAPEKLPAEADHLRRKLDKMTRSFDCFQALLEGESTLQLSAPKIR